MLLATLALALAAAAPSPAWTLDDFSDPRRTRAHDLGWMPITDALFGGTSTLELSTTDGALHLTGRVGEGPRAFAGAWAPLDGAGRSVDLGSFSAIRLRVRGRGRFQAAIRSGPPARQQNFMAPFDVTERWSVVELPFGALTVVPPSPGAAWDARVAHWVGIVASGTPGVVRLEIDEVALVGTSTPPPAEPGPSRARRAQLASPPPGPWTRLGDDDAGDATSARLPDGTGVEVHRDAQRTWFRARLAGVLPEDAFGINVVLDTDGDPANGSPWWGTNGGFHFDRLVSAYLTRVDGGYQGIAGVASAEQVGAGQFMALDQDVSVALDADGPAIVVGVRHALLETGRGPLRLVVAVGSAMAHNDDLPDRGAFVLDR